MCDDRGFSGPYTDLISAGMVFAGIIIFFYLMVSAYSSYTSSAFLFTSKEDIRALAGSMINDPIISADGYSGMLDAKKLDANNEIINIFRSPGHSGARSFVSIESSEKTWEFGQKGSGAVAIKKMPVSIRLNDARCIPGSITIMVWEGK
jgi:hypothetical protein